MMSKKSEADKSVVNEQVVKKEKVKEIARWLLEALQKDGVLYQDFAASYIYEHFGEDFVPPNSRGNPSIRRDVLSAFDKIARDLKIWSKSERRWRLRQEHDEPGVRQEP